MNCYTSLVGKLLLAAALAGCDKQRREPSTTNSIEVGLPKKRGRGYSKVPRSSYWVMPPESLRGLGYRTRSFMMNSQNLAYSLYAKGDWLLNGDDVLIVNNVAYLLEAGNCDATYICLYLNDERVVYYSFGFEESERWRNITVENKSFLRQTDTWHDTPPDEPRLHLELLSLRDSVFTDSVASAVRHYPPDFYRSPAVLMRKGLFLEELGFHREAVLFYEAVMAHFPKYAKAYWCRAEAYYSHLGRRAEARRDYRTYLALRHEQGKYDDDTYINRRLRSTR